MGNLNEDDDLLDEQDAEGGAAAEGQQVRKGMSPFVAGVVILGAIFLLGVIVLVAALFFRSPQQNAGQQAAEANNVISTQNAEVQATATQEAINAGINAQLLTPSFTPTATKTLAPPTPTHTAVVAQFTPTSSPTATVALSGDKAKTATVAALFTQAAAGKITNTPTPTSQSGGGSSGSGVVTSTTLPKAGFADDVGLPGLFGLSVVLIAVIILVRRLRLSASA